MVAQQVFHLFVFDTLADWEVAFVTARLHSSAAFAGEPGRYQVRTVGLSREAVVTMGGVTILPVMTLDALEPAVIAMLILPADNG